MSRLHRAVEKAEREGLLKWTRPLEQQRHDAPEPSMRTVEPAPAARPVEELPPPEAREAHAPAGPHLRESSTARPAPEEPRWDTGAPDSEGFSAVAFSPLLVAATEPGSAAAEQYRLLQTRLEAHDVARRTQVLLVTSPQLGDGKTTTSANLALTMATEFEHRVVLVEADLRRPALAAQFGLRVEHGLVDVLMGGLPLEAALVRVPGHRLTLLPAGAEAARSTELLASSMMHRTLEELRARFDHIVVDTTPVALADTHVLARLADGVLVVVRAGITPRPALERALASIDRERLVGIVLNEVEEATGAYSYPGLEYSSSRRE